MSFDKPLNRFKSQTKANKLPLDVLYNLVVKPKSNKFLFPLKVLRRRPVLSESFTAAHSFSLQLFHPKASGEPRPVPILFYFQPMLESPAPCPSESFTAKAWPARPLPSSLAGELGKRTSLLTLTLTQPIPSFFNHSRLASERVCASEH